LTSLHLVSQRLVPQLSIHGGLDGATVRIFIVSHWSKIAALAVDPIPVPFMFKIDFAWETGDKGRTYGSPKQGMVEMIGVKKMPRGY
jgi:hypothetical protein